jgi:hypothetical protein
MSSLLMLGGSRRPRPVQQPAIAPPWDQSDSYGQVHTTPPPEWQPPKGYDPKFLRGDFTGITLPGAYAFNGPGTDCTMTDGPYKGLVIPWKIGANSTPAPMLMSGMLPLYPRAVQDAWLTESALRDYSHVMIAPDGWNLAENGYDMTPQKLVAWAEYVKSWGNYVLAWRGMPQIADPALQALYASGCVDFWLCGEEIDGKIPAEQLPPILDSALATAPGVPIGVHFTANYPDGFPRDTFLAGGASGSWADYNGRVHLCWQANQDDSAGKQGAMSFYARQRVQLGLVGGDGRPAPDSRVYLYEIMATNELYGRCSEGYGNLRTLEGLFAPAGLSGISMLGGFLNGGRYADGTPI